MPIDDETVNRNLDAVFAGVAGEAATEAERGPMVHATAAGYRTYAKQDGDTAVITTAAPGSGVMRHKYVGVDLTALS
jgi:hypothetical protein